jgi:hypothetical protein
VGSRREWWWRSIKAVGATQRYPGGIGYSYYEYVPSAGLKAFESFFLADPSLGVATARPPRAFSRGGRRRLPPALRNPDGPPLGRFHLPPDLNVCPAGSPLAVSHAVASAQFIVPLVIGPHV